MLEMKTTNNDNLLIKELVQSVKQLSCQINNLEKTNQEMMEKLNSIQTKTVTGFNEPLVTLGPRLQKINPETCIDINDPATCKIRYTAARSINPPPGITKTSSGC